MLYRYLHDKTLQAHSVVRVPFALVEFQIVVEYQVGLHVGRYRYPHCSGSWNRKFMNISESFEQYLHALLVSDGGKCNAIVIITIVYYANQKDSTKV